MTKKRKGVKDRERVVEYETENSIAPPREKNATFSDSSEKMKRFSAMNMSHPDLTFDS